MKMKIMISSIGIIALLIVGMYISTTGFAQQKPDENSITKDILLTHIDGNTTLNLDLSKHIGLTSTEIKKLIDNLSLGMAEKAPDSIKGVTVEILKPLNATLHRNVLVISEIKTYPVKDMDVRVKIKEREWLNSKELSDMVEVEFDKDKVPVITEIIGPKNTALLKIYNTTKSRINLKNWQIRFTFGTIPDTAADRVIDRLSNVNEKEWKRENPPNKVEPLHDSYSITFSRKIDFELLNDPTKTQDEQLSAIFDGTHQTSWDIKKSPKLPQWIEIQDPKGGLLNLKGQYILILPSEKVKQEDLPKVETRVIISPRKPANENLPPTR